MLLGVCSVIQMMSKCDKGKIVASEVKLSVSLMLIPHCLGDNLELW